MNPTALAAAAKALEIWKPDGLYHCDCVEVSSLGRVRTLDRVIVDKRGVEKKVAGRILRQSSLPKGYKTTHISTPQKCGTVLIHRMVCAAFHGAPPEGKPFACHANGIPDDNRPENLRWASAAENAADAGLHGTHKRGSEVPNSKLTENQVEQIRERAASGEFQRLIGADFGIDQSHISAIARRAKWAHV